MPKCCASPSSAPAIFKALLSDDSIRRTVTALGDLPSLPRTYEALTQALADPDTSLLKVAKIIEQDVGISAKVLQLVNSAFFGIAHSMTNIQSAVSYLGINTLKNLVLSVEIFRAFKPQRELPGFSLEKLQHHAQLTAHIAARLPVPKHLADIAVVAGMLHDVGKLILAWKLSEHFEKVLAEALGARCPVYTSGRTRWTDSATPKLAPTSWGCGDCLIRWWRASRFITAPTACRIRTLTRFPPSTPPISWPTSWNSRLAERKPLTTWKTTTRNLPLWESGR